MNDTPWLEKKAWAKNQITSYTKIQLIISYVFSVIWSWICYGLYIKRDELLANASEEPAVYLLLLFPLSLIAILFQTYKQYSLWRTIGPMPLSLDPFPGAIGGHVGGKIACKLAHHSEMSARVKLLCIKRTHSNNSSNSGVREHVEWENDGVCHVQANSGGCDIRFRFDVQEGLPPSGRVENSKTNVIWRVELEIDDKIQRLYEIPVFESGEKSQHICHGTETYEATGFAAGEALSGIAQLKRTADKSTIYFAPFKRPLNGVLLVLIGVLFASIGIIVDMNDAPMIFGIVFPLIGLGLALAGLQYLGKALLVTIDSENLKSQRLYFGISFSSQSLPIKDIQSFYLKGGATVSYGTKTTTYYQLFTVGKNAQKYRVAERLNSRSEANKVEKTICEIVSAYKR
ncbi:hypothetical protein PN836_013135 [Ningiella sp. W23]|uniref:hypothetical protein n=1 Tax=Ningiella sp. W23 TaxID=3023715 RepID=UPI0037571BB9